MKANRYYVHSLHVRQMLARFRVATTCYTTLCLKKNDNDVLRYNFNAHQPILLNKYAIKWLFVIPPLLTNVSALPWESRTPKMGLFSHAQK